ncbi:F-box/WD repeat-containing protein 7 [Nematostella vectensis]|uniref:F-box/WD repeat-containing protein 7 n=1 Tax=Nematostella vectensis TaxID=45351 RepID=UPI002076F819|nr:F-box/WD repeat-containing protein 7 [Nematostella vectensis]
MSYSTLPLDELVLVFGFLHPKDLVNAAQVCKLWREAAGVSSLWKKHCLRKWMFCNLSNIEPGHLTWQLYYQARYKVDTGVSKGRPGLDYTCKTLRGHPSKINDVVYVTSNSIYDEGIIDKAAHPVVASCDLDGMVCLWNPHNGKQLWKNAEQHNSSILCLAAVKPNGSFASGDSNGNVVLWEIESGESNKLPESHNSPIVAMVCGEARKSSEEKKLFFVGARNGEVKLLDVHDSFKLHTTLECPVDVLDSLLLYASHRLVVSGHRFDSPSNVRVYDIRQLERHGRELYVLPSPPDASCTCFCAAPSQSNFLAVGYSDGNVKLWDTSNGREVHNFSAHMGSVTGLTAVGNTLVSIGQDLKTCVWSVSRLELLTSYLDHNSEITSVYGDAFKVVTCSRDYSIRVYGWGEARALDSKYTLLGGSLQRAGQGFDKVICDYTTCIGMANNVLKAYSFQA